MRRLFVSAVALCGLCSLAQAQTTTVTPMPATMPATVMSSATPMTMTPARTGLLGRRMARKSVPMTMTAPMTMGTVVPASYKAPMQTEVKPVPTPMAMPSTTAKPVTTPMTTTPATVVEGQPLTTVPMATVEGSTTGRVRKGLFSRWSMRRGY